VEDLDLLSLGERGSIVHRDARPATDPGPHYQVRHTVRVDVAQRDPNSTTEVRINGEEIIESCGRTPSTDRSPVEDLNARPTAHLGPDDEVRLPIAVHIAHGNVDAVGEGGVVRIKGSGELMRGSAIHLD